MAAGVVLFGVGLVLRGGGGRLAWFGHLPGDIHVGNVYIPLATGAVVSVVLTLVLNLIVLLFGR